MEIKTNKVSYNNLKNISISFKEGLINGIIGCNGSGKTSLANVLSVKRYPNQGYVEIDGVIIDPNNPMISYDMISFEVGYVAQNISYQIFGSTVREYFTTILNKYNYKNNKKHVIDSLKLVDLDSEVLNQKINNLSDSEKFKVLLASVLCLNPKVLILDEPIAYLDYKSIKNLIKLLKTLKNRYHKTIILLSDNLDFIYEICDYIYVLKNNAVKLEGTKKEIFKNHDRLKKYNINLPRILEIEKLIAKKVNIKMTYRDNISDLLKDIYFYKN